MAISLDMIFDATVPLWLEVSLALVAALLLAFAKIYYLPKSQRKKGPNSGEASDTAVARTSFTLSQTIEAEVAAGRSAAALAAWRAVKRRCTVPVESLPHLVHAFLEAEPSAFAGEMIEHMRAHAATLATPKAAAVVLDIVARSGNVQLLEDVATSFQQRLHIPRGAGMCEALLNGFAAAGCKAKVDDLLMQMRARKLKVTVRGFSLIIKGYLRSGLLDEALFQIGEMRAQGFQLPSFAVAELFRSAREVGRSREVLDRVSEDLTLSSDAVTILLEDCLVRQDKVLAERVTLLADDAGLPLAPAASEALLRLYASTGDVKALKLLDDMRCSGSLRFSEGFCVGILTRCAESKFLRLAEEVARCAQTQEGKMTVTLYSALMKVYAYCGMYSKACDLYEQLRTDGLQPDSIMYGCVLRFANECGRSDLVQELSNKVDACDVQHCMSLMRAAGSEGRLDRAFEHFEKLKVTGGKPDVASYNCLVDVCVNAGDMQQARELLESMRSIGHVDKISYNTMIKGYCAQSDAEGAQRMLQEMEAAGFVPNDITFNSLINMAGSSGRMSDAWRYIRDMQQRGIPLDKYTICTMLKSLRRTGGSRRDTVRVLELLDGLNLEICSDEVLLNIVLDTCIRQSEHPRLEAIMAAYEKSNLWPAAHTYGSLIRAYSAVKRLDRCRALWVEMMEERRMELNSIVFGCMLDAFVCANCMEEALALFNKWKRYAAGNSVIYSTLMKGFANSHLPDQAVKLFHEMRAAGIRPTTTSYNTVADAQARVGNAKEVQQLVEYMKEDRCKPDHVTHSIMVKAFCIAGDLEQACQVFKTMRTPDSGSNSRSVSASRDGSVTIAFNTLLDGCIKHNKMSLADQLLDQVEEFGVHPTNFTLCIFLKMCGRRRQLARALRATDTWPRRYHFTINSAVRTCLLSACIKCESVESAIKVFEDGKASGFADAKSYGVLINGCVRYGALDEAVRLVEEAYGLNRGDSLQPGWGLEIQVLENLIQTLVHHGSGARVAQPLLQRLQDAGVPLRGLLTLVA